jgi:hypothetical protein
MKHSERFALNQWLSDYPADKTYDEIIDLIHEEDESVTLWERIDGYGARAAIEEIENTRYAVERMMDNLERGLPLAEKTEEESIEEGAMP